MACGSTSYPRALCVSRHGHFASVGTGTLRHNPLVSSVSFSVSWLQHCVHNGDNPANAVRAEPVQACSRCSLRARGFHPSFLRAPTGRSVQPGPLRTPLPCVARRGGVEVSGRRASHHNDAPRALPRGRRTKGGSGEKKRSAHAPHWVYFSVTFSPQDWLRFG